MPIYVIGQLIVLLLLIGVLGGVYAVLRHLLGSSRRSLLSIITILVLAWLLLLGIISTTGGFSADETGGKRLVVAFLVPFVVLFFLVLHLKGRRLLGRARGRWLVQAQGIRIATELFFWMGWRVGFIPLQMTFAGFNYDIIVGLSALLASQVFFWRGRPRRLEIMIWNTFGLFSLLYLLFIVILSWPDTSWTVFSTQPNSLFLGQVPFIWLWGVLYPLAGALHIYAIVWLWTQPSGRARFGERLKQNRP